MTEAAIHPTDLEGQEARAEARARHELAVAHERGRDLAQLVSTSWGRRLIREQLRDGRLSVRSDVVDSLASSDHGDLCFKDALRTRALRVLWPLLRMVAEEKLPPEALALLFTEKDQ